MDLITRREALALRRIRFYTGRCCKYGHDSERFVSNGACVACVNPKREPVALAPLETLILPNGETVSRLSKERAHAQRLPNYFDGLPCKVGHLSLRRVSDDRCLECAHPKKYGPRGTDGWLAFQPKPPLAVPPTFPLALWGALATRVQAAIPALIAELSPATVDVQPEFLRVYDLLLQHTPTPDQILEGRKTWWRFKGELPPRKRTLTGDLLPDGYNREVCDDLKNPWVFRGDKWFLVAGGKYVPFLLPGLDYLKPEKSWIEANP